MRTLKLTIQYDGTEFVGWQRQPNGPSIQALVEDALAPIEGTQVAVHGAGRTDAGVHALAQVASVSLGATLDEATIGRALNAVLPPAVRVLDVAQAEAGFHARFSARSKTYEYRIVNAPLVSPFLYRYAWHVPQPLDLEAMRAATAPLVGTHDFAAFQGTGADVASTVRTIHQAIWQQGAGYDGPATLRITGDGFLRHMVRNIVGTLIEVGLGRWEPHRVRQALESRARAHAGPTAPARGLFLARVEY